MFEGLIDRFQIIKRKVLSYGRITKTEIDTILKDIRINLLEADVHYQIVKEFVENLSKKAQGLELQKSLNPGDLVLKLVYEELVLLLGQTPHQIEFKQNRPTIISLIGLQGVGKTTTAAKLALRYKSRKPLLVPLDTKRPAAVEQLDQLAKRIGIPIYPLEKDAILTAKRAKEFAHKESYGLMIIDTAGRLHIDEELISELNQIDKITEPDYRLLVADGMTGQDAVNQAKSFKEKVGLDGAILTKMDGDARGGAALSITRAADVPIYYIGTSESLEGIEEFYPARIAQRILGMGDIESLVEKVKTIEKDIDQQKLKKKMIKGELNLQDFMEQLKAVKRLGPLAKIAAMLPGVKETDLNENELKRIEAIISSMTKKERLNPEIIDGSRKKRIARGSGTTTTEVNQLLKQFYYARDLLKKMSKSRPRYD